MGVVLTEPTLGVELRGKERNEEKEGKEERKKKKKKRKK